MEVLGIGPLELLLVVLLALIILGPKEMQNAGKILGKNLNKLVKSDIWKVFRQTSEKIKYLPNELMREAELDEHKIAPENRSIELPGNVPPTAENPAEPPRVVPPAGVKPPNDKNKTSQPEEWGKPPTDEHQHG
jgi:Sec-independent protein translocase protein TatA